MYLGPAFAPNCSRSHEEKNQGSSSAATAGRFRRATVFCTVSQPSSSDLPKYVMMRVITTLSFQYLQQN